MICQQCEAVISDNSNFCTHCGAPITSLLAGTPLSSGAPLPTRHRLDLGKLLSDSFELYKRHFGTMCLVGLFMVGIPMVLGVGAQVSAHMMEMMSPAKNGNGTVVFFFLFLGIFIVTYLLQFFSQWYFILGALRQSLYLARGGTGFQTNQMFPPFMMFLKVVGLMLLIMCITMPMILPAIIMLFATGLATGVGFHKNIGAEILILPIVATIVLFIAGYCAAIWMWVRLFLAQMFIADRDAEVIDSMKYAWRVSSGNFWMLLLATFVLGILSMLGIFLCCVGIVMTAAITSLGSVLAYMQLTGQANCLDYPPLMDTIE